MKCIQIKNVTKNNLRNFSVTIPLQKLVVIVGPSGSGKSTLVDEVLYKGPQNEDWNIKNLPKNILILEQKVILPQNTKQSLGEYNFETLKKKLAALHKDDLLIVDEPCAGFCEKERKVILKLLQTKVRKGFSIVVVEHNREVIARADYVIELGPGSGRYGGKVIFEGNIQKFKKSGTITAQQIFTQTKNEPRQGTYEKGKSVTISKINTRTLKDFSFAFPLTKMVCVTGCSGSGKSTLLDIAYRALFKGKNAWKIRLKSVSVDGKTNVRRSFIVPQSPIGNHPSSTLATYTQVWGAVRDIFAAEKMSKQLGVTKSHFVISKEILEGKKSFSEKVLKVHFHKKNILDVFTMTIDEALELFVSNELIVRKLQFLQEVGLGYLVLGQKSSSLSGGEAQRVRMAKILSKKLGDRAVYIFDTPTRGLHTKDIPVLVRVFRKIIEKNNTILLADNREEIFNYCDFRISLSK